MKYTDFWDKISNKRISNTTIKESDLDNIFGYSHVGKGNDIESVRNWLYYEKMLSIDSFLFNIDIIKDEKVLTALLRRYKDRETKTELLKISVKNSVK